MNKELFTLIKKHMPQVDYWSVRLVVGETENLCVRKNIPEPPSRSFDFGYMVTIHNQGGMGYGASSNISSDGVQRAIAEALKWSKLPRNRFITDFSAVNMPSLSGEYKTTSQKPYEQTTFSERMDILQNACETLKTDSRVIEWQAGITHTHENHFFEASNGASFHQEFSMLSPDLNSTVADENDVQNRSLYGFRGCYQGGLEILDRLNFHSASKQVTDEALQLLKAPNCPVENMSLLLMPDQMMLQIHESIGHPVELDRILGDERNYAGTSFVTQEMFGNYQYGSKLLNVTFDPSIPHEAATYNFDDDGAKATKEYIIKDGTLIRPLGGSLSQQRANCEGVANCRASTWKRPPIDRMANLNLELGSKSQNELVSSIERGVLMASNKSWSIDDSRNKFQFGCEWGQMIENGKLTHVVKNPNYRGISATFWRNLSEVGDGSTFGIFGTPYCGKGEPNQCIRVGHASPACVFSNVDVFGGDES